MTDPTGATAGATEPSGPAPRRWPLAVAALVVVAVGLAVRGLPGVAGDAAGGVLYAVLVTLLVALLVPRGRPVVVGAVALGLCVAVELAQLTGVPARAVEAVPLLRYLLGTTFHGPDLAAYVVGTCAASWALLVVGGRSARRTQAVPDRGR